jgi:hypothetical protein
MARAIFDIGVSEATEESSRFDWSFVETRTDFALRVDLALFTIGLDEVRVKKNDLARQASVSEQRSHTKRRSNHGMFVYGKAMAFTRESA